MSACNCCDAPTCGKPLIICDTISASKTKCAGCSDGKALAAPVDGNCTYEETETLNCCDGYLNPDDGLYYAVKVTTVHCEYSETNPPCDPPEPACVETASVIYDTVDKDRVSLVDGVCVETHEYTSGSCSTDITYHDAEPEVHCTETRDTDGVWSGDSGCCSDRSGRDDEAECTTTITHEEVLTIPTDETTAAMITRTEGALPAYSGTYTEGACTGSFRNLAEDESSYTIRRTKWKVRHYATDMCYLKVWLRKRFTPEGSTIYGVDDVLTDLATYTWVPTVVDGTCIPDPTKSVLHDDNRIDTAATEELEPATDGTTMIEVKKWSCLDGYEPDDPNDDGSRPDPDTNPNGLPALP